MKVVMMTSLPAADCRSATSIVYGRQLCICLVLCSG